jgi:hypothetical protein
MATQDGIPDTILGQALRLRFQERCCLTCRFYRRHRTVATVSSCLLLGRDLAIMDPVDLDSVDRTRVCDGWTKRPSTWSVASDGVDQNPFWKDPHLSRQWMHRLRRMIYNHGVKVLETIYRGGRHGW